jgi:hypothetical protein
MKIRFRRNYKEQYGIGNLISRLFLYFEKENTVQLQKANSLRNTPPIQGAPATYFTRACR